VSVRKAVVIAALVVIGLMAGTVRADESDQAIKVTFSQAVQVPGHVLPAGTYWFTMMDTNDKEIVRIENEQQSKTLAMIQTINRDRPEWQSHTQFNLAERSGEPAAVEAWFYPGRSTGHEFVYPKQIERELAMAKQDMQYSGD
jgi:hypothetical protein